MKSPSVRITLCSPMILLGLLVITPMLLRQEAQQGVIASASPAPRTIEFETSEVTEADVTVSPDGQWLIR